MDSIEIWIPIALLVIVLIVVVYETIKMHRYKHEISQSVVREMKYEEALHDVTDTPNRIGAIRAIAIIIGRDRAHAMTLGGIIDSIIYGFVSEKPSFERSLEFWNTLCSISVLDSERTDGASALFGYLINSASTKDHVKILRSASIPLSMFTDHETYFVLMEKMKLKIEKLSVS